MDLSRDGVDSRKRRPRRRRARHDRRCGVRAEVVDADRVRELSPARRDVAPGRDREREVGWRVRTQTRDRYSVITRSEVSVEGRDAYDVGTWIEANLNRLVRTRAERDRKIVDEIDIRPGLTDREVEVLRLVAKGMSNKEIASDLDVSPNTVKTHVARLFEKLEVRRRTEAILRARELGMLQ